LECRITKDSEGASRGHVEAGEGQIPVHNDLLLR
jgi:hypothetical protein